MSAASAVAAVPLLLFLRRGLGAVGVVASWWCERGVRLGGVLLPCVDARQNARFLRRRLPGEAALRPTAALAVITRSRGYIRVAAGGPIVAGEVWRQPCRWALAGYGTTRSTALAAGTVTDDFGSRLFPPGSD